MITTRAMPALLPAHHRRVASQTTVKNDFADPLAPVPAAPFTRASSVMEISTAQYPPPPELGELAACPVAGLPDVVRAYQVPPKLVMPWPCAAPGPASPENV